MHNLPKTALSAAIPFAVAMSIGSARAATVNFSTGTPDGLIGSGAGPSEAGALEIETADDFILDQQTSINHASFYGLIPEEARIESLALTIYRVFPNDSIDPPSGNVPTRENSPGDDEIALREGADLSYTTTDLGRFSVLNTILDGINPIPDQTTGGEGPASGIQVLIDVALALPFLLPADHYFFVPQVTLDDGSFLWLSAAKPIDGGTGPFAPDLQSWIRDENLAPDWLRVGTDVIGAGPFNAAFSLSGETVEPAPIPLPASGILLGAGLLALLNARRNRSRMPLA